jgi:hypothetical protein
MNKETGLGEGRGTVMAVDDWWKKRTKLLGSHLLAI